MSLTLITMATSTLRTPSLSTEIAQWFPVTNLQQAQVASSPIMEKFSLRRIRAWPTHPAPRSPDGKTGALFQRRHSDGRAQQHARLYADGVDDYRRHHRHTGGRRLPQLHGVRTPRQSQRGHGATQRCRGAPGALLRAEQCLCDRYRRYRSIRALSDVEHWKIYIVCGGY